MPPKKSQAMPVIWMWFKNVSMGKNCQKCRKRAKGLYTPLFYYLIVFNREFMGKDNWLIEDEEEIEMPEVVLRPSPEQIREHEKKTRRLESLISIHKPIKRLLDNIHLDAPRRVIDARRRILGEKYKGVDRIVKYDSLTQMPEGEKIGSSPIMEVLFSPALMLHSYLITNPAVTPVPKGFSMNDNLINAVIASELLYDAVMRTYNAAIGKKEDEESKAVTDDIQQNWEYDAVRSLNDGNRPIEDKFVEAHSLVNDGMACLRMCVLGIDIPGYSPMQIYEKSISLRAEMFSRFCLIGAMCARADAVEKEALAKYGFEIGKTKWRIRDYKNCRDALLLLYEENELKKKVEEEIVNARKAILGTKPRKFQESKYMEVLTWYIPHYIHRLLVRD